MTPEEQGRRFWAWYYQDHVPSLHCPLWFDWREHTEFRKLGELCFVELFRLAAEGDELSIKIRNLLLKHRLTCGE